MEYITTEAERAYKKRYNQKNRDMINERQKRYREEHKESIRAYNKQYSMTHDRSEYFRQRYLRKKAGNVSQTHSELFLGTKMIPADKVEGEKIESAV